VNAIFILASLLAQSPDASSAAVFKRGWQEVLECYRKAVPLPANTGWKFSKPWIYSVSAD